MTDATSTTSDEPADGVRLVEVWGDTVDERSVKIAVVLGIVLAVPSFLIAQRAFSAAMENQDLARTWAMIVGLASCLVAGGIAARMFKPQRIVTERSIEPEDQRQVVRELAANGGIGSVEDLTPAEQDELRRLGLYDVFADVEAELRAAEAAASDLSAAETAAAVSGGVERPADRAARSTSSDGGEDR